MRKLILTIPVFAVLAMAAAKFTATKPAAVAGQNMPSKGCCEPPPCFVDPTQCGR